MHPGPPSARQLPPMEHWKRLLYRNFETLLTLSRHRDGRHRPNVASSEPAGRTWSPGFLHTHPPFLHGSCQLLRAGVDINSAYFTRRPESALVTYSILRRLCGDGLYYPPARFEQIRPELQFGAARAICASQLVLRRPRPAAPHSSGLLGSDGRDAAAVPAGSPSGGYSRSMRWICPSSTPAFAGALPWSGSASSYRPSCRPDLLGLLVQVLQQRHPQQTHRRRAGVSTKFRTS